MIKAIWCLACVLYLPIHISAQVFPKEGSKLNYRIIGFSFPRSPKIQDYTIEIAQGEFSKEELFERNIIVRQTDRQNRIVAEVPSFGAAYTWRAIYKDHHAQETKSPFYHFTTGIVPEIETSLFRLRILHAAEKYKDAYVFVDGSKVLYDIEGKPVWYLPEIDGSENAPVRDLKLSHRGTVTFMSGANAEEQIYEMDYDGHVLWKGPNTGKVSGGSSENYHHQFTRLSNGHYMVLGTEYFFSKGTTLQPDTLLIKATPAGEVDHLYTKIPMLTLIEYDESGNVAWCWKSSEYFGHSDVRYRKTPSGNPFEDVHGNAFFFDQDKQNIYISFRNINRILKISYPDGKILGEYGKIYSERDSIITPQADKGNGLYCNQHYCIPSEGQSLYVFNNNACNKPATPTIVKLAEPQGTSRELKKIWEYNCSLDELSGNTDFASGGNIAQLSDSSIFVNMGGIYSKLFIVTQGKDVLWSALPERWIEQGQKWQTTSQYRASMIFRNDLEKLILGVNSIATPASNIVITYNSNK